MTIKGVLLPMSVWAAFIRRLFFWLLSRQFRAKTAASVLPIIDQAPTRSTARRDFELKPFIASSNWIGSWQLANTLIPYGLLWWLAVVCLQHRSWWLVPVLALMVLFLARCFSLMHDCGHHSLFRSRRANRIAGFLLGVVAGIPQLPWSRGHAFHHRHNGNWEQYKGPSAVTTVAEYAQRSKPHKALYRLLRHPLMLLPGGFFYLVIKPRIALLSGLADLSQQAIQQLSPLARPAAASLPSPPRLRWASRAWHSPEEGLDLLLNNLAVLAIWMAAAAWIGPGNFWLIYTPVMSLGAAIFICIFFVQHNFPGSYARSNHDWRAIDGVLAGTSNLLLPPLLNWFSADIGCHAIHHLCEAIPNYRLRACQERNAHLLHGVIQLRLADFASCFPYVLWDPDAGVLTTVQAGEQPNP